MENMQNITYSKCKQIVYLTFEYMRFDETKCTIIGDLYGGTRFYQILKNKKNKQKIKINKNLQTKIRIKN